MNEILEVGGLTFAVHRSSRRKTLGLTVDRGGELVIHAPEDSPEQELTQWTRTKLLWIHRKLAIKEELAPRACEPEYVTGESFSYLGRSHRLKLVTQQRQPLLYDGRRFYLRCDAREEAGRHFRNWFIAVGKEWIVTRAELIAPKIGARPARVAVRDLGFRWGSCGWNHVIYFNWKVLQLPIRLADYVLAHEMSHLIVPNHQPEFWRVLERAVPDWKDRQTQLRKQAAELHWCGAEMVQ